MTRRPGDEDHAAAYHAPMVDERDDVSMDDTLLPPDDDDNPTGDARTVASATNLPSLHSQPTQLLAGGRGRSADVAFDSARYRIGELLGKGGMGEVLLATDEQIGREVAIKRIRSAHPDADAIARFVREARIQGRLEHPAVVPVHDLGVDGEGKPFFVMKRLTGTVMSSLLHRETEDPIATRRRLLRAFADVCLAVELAHSKGIIHRDLKPANIMLGDFGEVYVLDWGIARAVGDTDETPAPRPLALESGDTALGTVLGTPAYMAPEQLAGERASTAADIYALGCILFEILAGKALHKNTRSAVMPAAAVDARPSRVLPDSPPELDAICTQATQLDPAARPTARALGAAVQAYLDGDRDVAVRRELAREQIARARAAVAGGDDEENRRIAMHAAGRALALDPTATEAAELITQLVLTPPKQVPAAVEETLVEIDHQTGRAQGRFAAISMLSYLAFVPLMLWTGMRQPLFAVAFAGLAVASGIQTYAMTRRERIFGWRIYANACINALLIGLVCRMVGPFIIAPTLVATTVMAYAAHPRFGHIGIVSCILAAAVVVPWALELFGVLSPTYAFVDGALVLRSPIVIFQSVPVQLAFALLLVTLLTVVAVLSRNIAVKQREASRRVELQAWHLRQLVG